MSKCMCSNRPANVLNVSMWEDTCVTTGILQIRWADDGDKDVAALATMYITEVPNESSISQRFFYRMF